MVQVQWPLPSVLACGYHPSQGSWLDRVGGGGALLPQEKLLLLFFFVFLFNFVLTLVKDH